MPKGLGNEVFERKEPMPSIEGGDDIAVVASTGKDRKFRLNYVNQEKTTTRVTKSEITFFSTGQEKCACFYWTRLLNMC